MNTKFVRSASFSFILSILGFIMFTSCSQKMSFTSSTRVPAATGSVSLKSDKNNNNTIRISINNLAPVSQLTPPYQTYVVWMVTENNETKNIGKLRSNTGFLSKALKASLSTVSSFKPVSFFITAENEGNVEYPGLIVLSTK